MKSFKANEKLKLPPSALNKILILWALALASCSRHASFPGYVGSSSCVSCHAAEGALWKNSHHARALMEPHEHSAFQFWNGKRFEDGSSRYQFQAVGKKLRVSTDDVESGEKTFEVRQVIGVEPLVQFLAETEPGKWQVLPLGWDTASNLFFYMHSAGVGTDDSLHWTRPAYGANHMCVECHVTAYQKNFDTKTERYGSAFHEAGVACEACHGPGQDHVRWAKTPAKERGPDTRLLHFAKHADSLLETCASCHSRRRTLADGYTPGKKFTDFYLPEFLDGAAYHPDGQILEENFEYGSFVQSKMHAKGVRCTDCHEPHSGKTRAEGNHLCLRCHEAARFDLTAHHHHPIASPGALCVNCHMPEKTYMVVHKRRDHSLRVPHPEISKALGTPNACSQCHVGRTA
ncbi:MAG: hypothetical protein JNM63_01675, partial [Spirochaetia bacterium]|nr:hypothetical protein [Spirochaetia bacterium]